MMTDYTLLQQVIAWMFLLPLILVGVLLFTGITIAVKEEFEEIFGFSLGFIRHNILKICNRIKHRISFDNEVTVIVAELEIKDKKNG